MSLRLDPPRAVDEKLAPLPPAPTAAVVTASHALDFDRCRLLCDTMDAYVSGATRHLILVEGRDVKKFRALAGPRREIVDERDLLPGWLLSVKDPFRARHSSVWLSLKTLPLRGWHVQQLRRIAIAAHAHEDHLVFCDSDVSFLKPFDCGVFAADGRTRLFRRDGALAVGERPVQRAWWKSAGELLGIAESPRRFDTYVTTLIAWRREAVNMMCRRIERVSGREWVAAVASARKYSECLLYGRFVGEVLGDEEHTPNPAGFCRVQWDGEPMSDAEFHRFVAEMGPEQAAICMQSFIGVDLERIRRLVLGPGAPARTPEAA